MKSVCPAKIRFSCLYISLGLAIPLLPKADGAILIGNLSQANDSIGTQISSFSPENLKAISFTTPDLSYLVTSVDLRLSGYTTPAPGTGIDVAVVGLYSDAAGSPGSLMGNVFNSPSSSSGVASTFSFSGSVALAPDTTYWLVVGVSAGSFNWLGANAGPTPAGPASLGTYKFSGDSVGFYSPSSVDNAFQINATPVPEPAAAAVVAAVGLAGFALWRRRDKTRGIRVAG